MKRNAKMHSLIDGAFMLVSSNGDIRDGEFVFDRSSTLSFFCVGLDASTSFAGIGIMIERFL